MTMLQSVLRRTVYAAAEGLGLNACLRTAHRRRLLVVCYHGVAPEEELRQQHYDRQVSLEEFRAQLAALGRLFRPVAPEDVLAWLVEGKPLPKPLW